MDKKNYLPIMWTLFGITALMMIGFPLYHIYSYGNIIANGTEYRIPCEIYYSYAPFSGCCVIVDPDVRSYSPNKYSSRRHSRFKKKEEEKKEKPKWVTIDKGRGKQLRITGVTTTRPDSGDYLPVGFERDLQTFYLNEKPDPDAKRALRRKSRYSDMRRGSRCELQIRVLNGKAAVEELYINNTPINEYLQRRPKNSFRPYRKHGFDPF